MTKQELIDFLEWMNKTAQENPMMLETDNDDIAQMYLAYLKSLKPKSNLIELIKGK
jgi:hypothetical protein